MNCKWKNIARRRDSPHDTYYPEQPDVRRIAFLSSAGHSPPRMKRGLVHNLLCMEITYNLEEAETYYKICVEYIDGILCKNSAQHTRWERRWSNDVVMDA